MKTGNASNVRYAQWLIAVILALEFVLLPSFVKAAIAADTDVGSVTALRGLAFLKRPGLEQRIVVHKGTAVRVGDIVQTGENGRGQVALTDESFFELNGGSSVRVNQYAFHEPENRRTAVVQVMEGQARFVVFRTRSGGSRFRVETGTAAIDPDQLVDFVVQVWLNGTNIMALHKGVRVRNISSLYVGEYRVGENQKTMVHRNKPPSLPEILSQPDRQALLDAFKML